MFTLMLLLALQVVSPGEMACVGSLLEMKVPEDVYIAGVEGEGLATYAAPGQILFLNGPGITSLKPGSVQRVVHPEGKVQDPSTKQQLGTYYKDIGTIRIEAVAQESATARVLMTCELMQKGDLVLAAAPKPVVEFSGAPSNKLTPLPKGPFIPILMAKDDSRQLAAGQFCFIKSGKRDGVKPGDHFIVFRPHPRFNKQDMKNARTTGASTYSPVRPGFYGYRMDSILGDRVLPHRILGDIVIVETGDRISTGKIINSMSEIYPGDLVVKR